MMTCTNRPLAILTLALTTLLPLPADARTRSHSGAHASSHGSQIRTASKHKASYSKASTAAERDKHGRIKRSTLAKNDFKKQHPCPATGKSSGACPGYVIDHKQALKRGGKDAPSNMQWQTKEAAKAKDRWE